jgi:hypothetical protein
MTSAEVLSRVVCIAVAAQAVLLAVSVGGCSPKSAAPAPAADAQAVCPSTIVDAAGAGCAVEGLVCSPQYMCGITPATLTCVCTEGSFSCQDVTGKIVTSGTSPACPAATANESCPTSEVLAEGMPCTRQGLFCPYPSTCGDTTKYDGCYCFTGPLANGQMGLRFECSTPCNYDAGPAVQDASEEAPATQGSADGAVDGRASNAD